MEEAFHIKTALKGAGNDKSLKDKLVELKNIVNEFCHRAQTNVWSWLPRQLKARSGCASSKHAVGIYMLFYADDTVKVGMSAHNCYDCVDKRQDGVVYAYAKMVLCTRVCFAVYNTCERLLTMNTWMQLKHSSYQGSSFIPITANHVAI